MIGYGRPTGVAIAAAWLDETFGARLRAVDPITCSDVHNVVAAVARRFARDGIVNPQQAAGNAVSDAYYSDGRSALYDRFIDSRALEYINVHRSITRPVSTSRVRRHPR